MIPIAIYFCLLLFGLSIAIPFFQMVAKKDREIEGFSLSLGAKSSARIIDRREDTINKLARRESCELERGNAVENRESAGSVNNSPTPRLSELLRVSRTIRRA